MKINLLAVLLLAALEVFGQKKGIEIVVVDQQNKALQGATVVLKSLPDSSQKLYQITDSLGRSSFDISGAKKFNLQISYIGYRTIAQAFDPKPGQNSYRFVLFEDQQTLGGVTVTARRPLMRQEDDKTVVDPEIIAASSTNAQEMLEKIPGLFIDNEGNVYLNGSQPSAIYINGREQKMTAADIATVLKNLPPTAIEKIEIIRTASAKYDAASSGGVVNIVLKKGVKIGRTGSFTTGANQGKYGAYFAGITLNNNDGDRTSYLNLNLNRRNYFEELSSTRSLADGSKIAQNSYNTTPNAGGFLSYGLGKIATNKMELNYDGRINYNGGSSQNDNSNEIFRNGTILSQSGNQVSNLLKNLGLSQEFSLKKDLDTNGSQISSQLAYNYNKRLTDQTFGISQTLPSTQNLSGLGDFDIGRHFVEAKIDLLKKLPGQISLEAGLKTGLQYFKNTTLFFDEVPSGKTLNSARSNRFKYNDAIHAAYLQGSKTFGAYIFKTGLRLENTNMNGRQLSGNDTSFTIHRTDVFPYAYLSRRLMKIAGYELRAFLIARRSITRPGYDYLNPGLRFLDQYLYESGNPALRPQFTQTYEANVSVADMPIFAFGKNYVNDIFTNVVYQDRTDPRISARTYDNLGKNEETYFRLLGAIPPGGKYFFVVSTQYNRNNYRGIYENSSLNFKRGSWTFFSFHQLKLGKLASIQSGGFLRVGGQQQFYELGNFGNVFASINRYFLDRKLQITLNANDLFYTNRNSFSLNQGNIQAVGERRADTRRFGFNLRYNFGLKKREEGNSPFNMDLENVTK